MRRLRRINWPLSLGVLCFFLLASAYVAWPLLRQLMEVPQPESNTFAIAESPFENVRERAILFLARGWFFVLGASIGSFLNVVAYRMPMGMTFVSKPSRCPYCETPIRFKHNVPILGWLALRGRCHACRLPISPRYILVELVVGLLFLTLFFAEIESGGRNLPIREPSSYAGVFWNLLTPKYDLIGIYAFHAYLLATLSTLALIKFDGLRVPVRLALFTFALGVTLRLVWPQLSVLPPPDWLPVTGPFEAIPPRYLRLVCDAVLGFVLGAIVQFTVSRSGGQPLWPSRCASMLDCTLVAIFCGWQAIVPAFLLAALTQLVVNLCGRAFRRDTSQLWGCSHLLGTWFVLCTWRHLPRIWLPGAESTLSYQLAAIAFGLATVTVAQWAAYKSHDDPFSDEQLHVT